MNTIRPRLKTGAALNGYTLSGYIGRGGFALTYTAERQGKRALIKEFFPRGIAVRESDAIEPIEGCQSRFNEWMTAFVREAQTLVRLGGVRGVMELTDFFLENGTAYIVTDYREGAAFSDYIEDSGGRLSVAETLFLLKPLFGTLSEIHARGVLHKDISPDNIFIDRELNVYMLDFGAASFHDIGIKEGESLKDGYSPPELYASGVTGVTADVYALGAVLYRAITGKPPTAAIDRAAGAVLDFPSEPQAIAKAMSMLPSDRYPSMEAFYKALYGGEISA